MGDKEARAQAARALELADESGQPRLEHIAADVALIALGDEPQAVRQLLEDEYERGGSAMSREALTPSGSSLSSSSKPEAGNLPRSRPLARATSRFSTGSRYPSTISPLP